MSKEVRQLTERIVDNPVIDYPNQNIKDSGDAGKFLEKFFINNPHTHNAEDIKGLEFKTKNIKAKSKDISLASYKNPKNALNRTFNKIKNRLGLYEYEIKKKKIIVIRYSIFQKCNRDNFKRLVRLISGSKDFSYSVNSETLSFMYNSIETIIA